MSENSFLGEDSKYGRFLGYFLLLYIFLFICHNIMRAWGWGFGIDDVGIYHQVIWNTANGNWFETSIKYPYDPDGKWLGFHFSILPILFTVPFYKLFPTVETLSVIHVSLVSLTAIIIYKICRRMELSGGQSFFWSLIYLLNPITVYHVMFSFQETSFTIPLLTLGFYFVITRRFYSLLAISALLLITKEHHGTTVFGFGLLWWWYNKSWREGVILCAIGVIAAYMVMFVIMPEFSAYGEHFMLSNAEQKPEYMRYQWLKLPFNELIQAAPDIIFDKENIRLTIFLPFLFAFLPLGAFIFLFPVAGDYLAIILSTSRIGNSFNFYYSAPFIPPMIVSTVYVLKKIGACLPKLATIFRWYIGIVVFICFGHPLYLSGSKLAFIAEQQNMDWMIGKDFQEVISLIPEDAALLADHYTGYSMANRRNIKPYDMLAFEKADYILVRINPFDFSPATRMQNSFALRLATEATQRPEWGLIYWKYPYALFKHGAKRPDDIDYANFTKEMSNAMKLFLEFQPPQPSISKLEKPAP